MDLYTFVGMYLCCIFVVRARRYSWRNNKDTVKIFFEFCLIAVVALFISSYPASAAEGGSFIESQAETELFSYSDTFGANQDLEVIVFYDVNYYQDIQAIIVYNIPNGYITFNDSANSHSASLTVLNETGSTVGTGTIQYGKLPTTTNLYIYMDSWNIGTESGEKNYSLVYNKVDLSIAEFKRWGNGGEQTEDKELALQYLNGTLNRELPYNYRVIHSASFRNDYLGTLSGNQIVVDVTKIFSGKAYNSTFKIYTSLFEYLNATSTNNEQVIVPAHEAPIQIEAIDSYGNEYDDTIFDIEGEYTIEGYTENSKTGVRIPGVAVSLNITLTNTSTDGGYYYLQPDGGLYWLNASVSGYQDYSAQITIASDRWFDIPLAQNLTVSGSEVGIYGLVLDSNTGAPIPTSRVDIENSTYEVTTYTNQNGYFQVTGLLNDTYDVTASKSGYYSDHNSVNASTLGISYYTLLYLVDESAIVTPTATPPTDQIDKQRSAIINLFVNVFGIPTSWINALIALLIILFSTILVGVYVGFDGALYGAIAGFLITIAMGLIPFYLVIVAICLGAAVLVWNRGD